MVIHHGRDGRPVTVNGVELELVRTVIHRRAVDEVDTVEIEMYCTDFVTEFQSNEEIVWVEITQHDGTRVRFRVLEVSHLDADGNLID